MHKHRLVAVSMTALAAAALAVPAAVAAPAAPMRLAQAANPCAAKCKANPCAAKCKASPSAAKANPCAAKCKASPCAAKASPCAAKAICAGKSKTPLAGRHRPPLTCGSRNATSTWRRPLVAHATHGAGFFDVRNSTRPSGGAMRIPRRRSPPSETSRKPLMTA